MISILKTAFIAGPTIWAFNRRRRTSAPALILAMAAIAVFHTIWNWDGRSSYSEEILRAHFRIPETVEFEKSWRPQRGSANNIEGIVKFSETEYRQYLSRLNNPAVWKPERIDVGPVVVEPPFSPGALRWKKLPKPIFAGVRRVRWGNMSRRVAYKAKSGYAFCLARRFPPGQRKSDWWREAPKGYEHRFPLETPRRLERYNSLGCAELGRSERPRGYILGLIDADTRTLHMIVR